MAMHARTQGTCAPFVVMRLLCASWFALPLSRLRWFKAEMGWALSTSSPVLQIDCNARASQPALEPSALVGECGGARVQRNGCNVNQQREQSAGTRRVAAAAKQQAEGLGVFVAWCCRRRKARAAGGVAVAGDRPTCGERRLSSRGCEAVS
ncbi:hypothetical protein BKA63DRAFT_47636 [Paraphoma chrysanthemicola]|nr:hypothetical protein BKA63DRAFT_47636 [Paraphoma chrysanthemicola]